LGGAGSKIQGREASQGDGLGIPFHPDHLAGRIDPRKSPEGEIRSQDPRGVKKGVPVKGSVTEKMGRRKSWELSENPVLFGVPEFGLETDQIEGGLFAIFSPELDNGMRPKAGPGIDETHRPHGTIGQGLRPRLGQ